MEMGRSHRPLPVFFHKKVRQKWAKYGMMVHILRTEEDVSWIRSIFSLWMMKKRSRTWWRSTWSATDIKYLRPTMPLDGLEILEKEEIHLVLLDIMMPGMDGLEMCRKIRETNNIPIIMLSAKSTDLDKILGLGTGADDYVVKPFNPAGADGQGKVPAEALYPA